MSIQKPEGGNTGIELHDARVLGISEDDDHFQIHLDVCIHHSQGTPGVDRGTCWRATVQMLLQHYYLTGTFGELPVYVADGTVVCDNTHFRNIVPIPLHYEGKISVMMLLEDGSNVLLNAEFMDWTIDGEMQFLEEFP